MFRSLVARFLIPLLLVVPWLAHGAWSGPASSISSKNGHPSIKICPDGSACIQTTPFFLSINPQGLGFSWNTFTYEANLMLAYTSPQATGLAPILQVNLGNTSDAFIDDLGMRLNALNGRPYLFVRYYLETPSPQPGMLKNTMADMLGHVTDNTAATGTPWIMNDTWLAYQEQELQRILSRIDAVYPGKTIGVQIAYGDGGEFFYRPYGYRNSQVLGMGSSNLCYDTSSPGSPTGCGLFPWSDDSTGTQHGRHYFYLSDYSNWMQASFCNWSALPAAAQTPGCPIVSVVDRNNGASGVAMPDLGKARGVFLDPGEPKSMRAAYYNRFLSYITTGAIDRLLAKAKSLTQGRILTSAFYGYLTGLDAALPTSGHTDLTRLLASPNVDFVVAPYSYRDPRSLGFPFLAQGPTHAPMMHAKLWIDEDDTRTHLACAPNCVANGFQTATTLWDSVRLLRRNVLTAGIRGNGLYFLDLGGSGWYGRPDMPFDSESIWANLQNAFKAVDTLQTRTDNGYKPQVALFIDDLSFNYTAALTPASDATYAYSTDITSAIAQDLAMLGTPVKQYLLSDLLTMSADDLAPIKFAVMPNAYNVPTSIRNAIDAKLKTNGRTLLFFYASGYMNGDAAASAAGIAALTGIGVSVGTGTPALTQSFNVGGNSSCGGPSYSLTPWFRINDAAATSLGSYASPCPGTAGAASLAYKTIPVAGGSYRSVYAASTRLPVSVLRYLSELAGVHHFAPVGDSVEARGNLLMIHAGSSANRVVTLPMQAPRVIETGLYPADSLICSNCSQLPTLYFDIGTTRVFRWTTPPNGNFEFVLSPATLEGWAADLDAPSTSIQVAIYRGAPKGQNGSTFVANIPTGMARPDVNQYFDITGIHGFHYPLGSCVSGTRYYAYAIDPEGSSGDGDRYIGTQVCP